MKKNEDMGLQLVKFSLLLYYTNVFVINLRFKRLDFSHISLEEWCFRIHRGRLCSLPFNLIVVCENMHLFSTKSHCWPVCADNNIVCVKKTKVYVEDKPLLSL